MSHNHDDQDGDDFDEMAPTKNALLIVYAALLVVMAIVACVWK